MAFFARICREHARAIVIICILLTIPVAAGIGKIEVKSGQKDLIPTKVESSKAIDKVEEVFGGVTYENIMVESGDFLTYPMIKKFILLEEEMKDAVGEDNYVFMEHYLSGFIVNMKNMAREQYGVEIDDMSLILMQEGVATPSPVDGQMIPFEEVIEQGVVIYLEDPVAQKWVIAKEGTALLSEDLQQAMIRIKVNPELSTSEQNQVARDMEEFFTSYFEEGEVPASVVISGDPSIDKELEEYVLSSTWILALIAFVFLMALLYLTFRRFSDVILPLLVIVIVSIWIYGLMGWLGFPYTVISVVIGPLVLGINLGNLLYLMSRFYEELGIRRDQREAARNAIVTVGVAIFLATVTTAFAFLSFSFSDFDALWQFGLLAGVGVLLCFLMSVTFLPSLMILREDLRQWRERKGKTTRTPAGINIFSYKRNTRLDRGLKRVADLSVNHSYAVLGVYAFIILISLLGVTRLTTTPDLRALAPQDIPSLQAQYEQEDVFGGQQEDFVLLEGDVLEPDTLVAMYDFQKELAASPYFEKQNVSSIGELIYDYRVAMGQVEGLPLEPSSREEFTAGIPSTREEVEVTLAEIADNFSPQEGKLVSEGHDAAMISVMSEGAKDNEEMLNKDDLLKSAAASSFGETKVSFTVGGITPLTTDLLGNLVPTQLSTALLALAFSAFILIIIFRSLSYGLATLSVLVAGVACEMGFMALMGWQLDMATVLIASMIIGIGIDYGIHITHRFLEEFRRGEYKVEDAVDISVMSVGKPLVASSISTAGAFAIVVFSSMTPISRFGAITAVSLVVSLVASLVVLPSIITLIARRKQRVAEEAGEIAEFQPAEVES